MRAVRKTMSGTLKRRPPQRGGAVAQSGIGDDRGFAVAMDAVRARHRTQAAAARADPEVEFAEVPWRTSRRTLRLEQAADPGQAHVAPRSRFLLYQERG